MEWYYFFGYILVIFYRHKRRWVMCKKWNNLEVCWDNFFNPIKLALLYEKSSCAKVVFNSVIHCDHRLRRKGKLLNFARKLRFAHQTMMSLWQLCRQMPMVWRWGMVHSLQLITQKKRTLFFMFFLSPTVHPRNPPSENDFSVGLLIQYKSFTYLTMGDLDGQTIDSSFGYCYNGIIIFKLT